MVSSGGARSTRLSGSGRTGLEVDRLSRSVSGCGRGGGSPVKRRASVKSGDDALEIAELLRHAELRGMWGASGEVRPATGSLKAETVDRRCSLACLSCEFDLDKAAGRGGRLWNSLGWLGLLHDEESGRAESETASVGCDGSGTPSIGMGEYTGACSWAAVKDNLCAVGPGAVTPAIANRLEAEASRYGLASLHSTLPCTGCFSSGVSGLDEDGPVAAAVACSFLRKADRLFCEDSLAR